MTTYKALLEQIEAMQQEAERIRRDEMSSAIAGIQATMQQYGISVADLRGARRITRLKSARAPVPPKYRDPVTKKTWSGRGKTPKWFSAKEREKFLIK